MIKRFVILRRKPGMSVRAFRDHWKNIHGPLVAKIPGIKRYVQYHVSSKLLDSADASIDGIAELWFESEAAQAAAWQTSEYEALVADEPNLFDMTSHCIHPVMTDEVVEF